MPHRKTDPHDEESAFVVSCLRALGPLSAAPSPPKDWGSATQSLERHGLLPVLGMAAAGISRSIAIPSAVQQLVLRQKLRVALYQANALDALAGISAEMAAAGIPYAVLKGTYLYERLYRDVFPREYGDIDLLVPSGRVEDAVPALRRAGYAGARRCFCRAAMPRWHFHVTLISGKPGGLPLELHRSLVDRANLYRVPDAALFTRLHTFQARGIGFTVLSAEDQLIYLCLHAAKHGILNFTGLRGGYAAEWYAGSTTGNRLLWFLDIELFLRKEQDQLDWHAVSERIQVWNVADDVINSLRVLDVLMPASQAALTLHKLGGLQPGSTPDPAGRVSRKDRRGALERMLRSRTGQTFLERSMRVHSMLLIRPVRLWFVWRIFIPSSATLLKYHGRTHRFWLPWLYLVHPFHMIRKLLMT